MSKNVLVTGGAGFIGTNLVNELRSRGYNVFAVDLLNHNLENYSRCDVRNFRQLTKIFEKFGQLGNVQLHSSGKTKFKGGGPGLGLPITKGLIEAHGGAIWVESDGYDELNYPGATFHVLLPILNEPPDKKIAKLFKGLSQIDQRTLS